jgi:hypothetical protein
MRKNCAFHPGSDVAMVDVATGHPVEIVRVSEVSPDGRVSIERYTAQFTADGEGLPLERWERAASAAVHDLSGRLVQPERAEMRLRARIPARYRIRPATAADVAAVRERDEADTIAKALHLRFRALDERGENRLPVALLRRIARLTGVDPAAAGLQ